MHWLKGRKRPSPIPLQNDVSSSEAQVQATAPASHTDQKLSAIPSGGDYFSQHGATAAISPNGASSIGSALVSPASTAAMSVGASTIFTPGTAGTLTPASTYETIDHMTIKPGSTAKLTKPIVIPRVLNWERSKWDVALPYHRAYPAILGKDYGISQEEFLKFIDNLNMRTVHHKAFDTLNKVGDYYDKVAQLDPTKLSSIPTYVVQGGANVGQLVYMRGPLSAKRTALRHANRDLFNPRGLQAMVMSSKKLRKELGVDDKYTLTAPMDIAWTVPTARELKKGQRSKCTTLDRIMHRLSPSLVQQLMPCDEVNETLQAHAPFGLGSAAETVCDLQEESEIKHETWRGEVLELYRSAENAKGRKKEKLLKKAMKKDKELKYVKNITWLVLRNIENGSEEMDEEEILKAAAEEIEEDENAEEDSD